MKHLRHPFASAPALAVLWLVAVSASVRAQVQLDLSLATPAAGSGTGWVAVNNSTAGKQFIDYQTLTNINQTGVNDPPGYVNLVGGTYSGSGASLASASYSVNPMLQVQTAYIGGSTAADLGIAFRMRLGSYAPANSVTGIVGVIYNVPNATNGTDAASFAIAATATSNGTTYTSWAVNLMWQTDSTTVNKANNFNTGAQGFAASTSTPVASGSFVGSTNSGFVSIQSTTNTFAQGGTDSSDAWLSFGVTFASVNNNVAAIARTVNGTVVPFDATTAKWGFAPVAATGTTPATFNGVDAVGSKGNIYMSDLLYANGSTVAGGIPTPVPEPSTYLMISAMLAPAVALVLRRRRSGRVV